MRILLSVFILLIISSAAAQQIAFVDANVVDVEKGRILPKQTVVISQNIIHYLGPKRQLPKGTNIINAKGKYLIPGLVDFNASVLNYEYNNEPALLLLLANGVTTVRDLQPTVPISFGMQLKQELESGKRIGPRLLLVSPLITLKGRRDKKIVVTTAEEGKAAVDSSVAAGADVIKIDNTLPPVVLNAVVQQAHQRGKRVIGGWTTPFTEAAEAGVDAIDHLSDLRRTTSINRQRYFDFYKADSSRLVPRKEFYNRVLPSLGTVDTPYFQQTIATLKKHNTWLCLNAAFMPSTVKFELGDTVRNHFRSARMKANLQKEKDEIDKLEDLPRYKEKVDMSEIKWAHDLGLKLLYGTQVYDFRTPGFTVHDGFYWMQENGFTPAEILQTATINPALFLKREKQWGSIAKGKIADVVLLDANPLEDIGNVKKIQALMLNGRLFTRQQLDELLHEASRKMTTARSSSN